MLDAGSIFAYCSLLWKSIFDVSELERACRTARARFAATLDIELVLPVAQTIVTSGAAAATSAAAAAAFAARVQIGAHAPRQTLVTKFDTGRHAAFEVCDAEMQCLRW